MSVVSISRTVVVSIRRRWSTGPFDFHVGFTLLKKFLSCHFHEVGEILLILQNWNHVRWYKEKFILIFQQARDDLKGAKGLVTHWISASCSHDARSNHSCEVGKVH